MSTSYQKMAVTPDYQKALIWNNITYIRVYNLATMTYLGTLVPTVTPALAWMTQKITFSADSSRAIFETGPYNPIAVFNLDTMIM